MICFKLRGFFHLYNKHTKIVEAAKSEGLKGLTLTLLTWIQRLDEEVLASPEQISSVHLETKRFFLFLKLLHLKNLDSGARLVLPS
jgi:hypothetical protein